MPQQQKTTKNFNNNLSKKAQRGRSDILKETEMEVDPVPSTSNDKGKQPEVPIPPVTNYGENESFDTTENLLGSNSNNNIINFAHEEDSPLFFAYCT
ncbi:654_t:CDS:2, partial [Funneliformis geosporum]